MVKATVVRNVFRWNLFAQRIKPAVWCGSCLFFLLGESLSLKNLIVIHHSKAVKLA